MCSAMCVLVIALLHIYSHFFVFCKCWYFVFVVVALYLVDCEFCTTDTRVNSACGRSLLRAYVFVFGAM